MSDVRINQYKQAFAKICLAITCCLATACGRSGPWASIVKNDNRADNGADVQAGLRIYGGKPVPRNQFNSVVALHDSVRVACSGTLIHPQVILTAGHCIETRPGFTAVSGVSFGQGREGGHKPPQQTIAATAMHPEFRRHPRGNMDIGLVFLDKPASVQNLIPAALLSEPEKIRSILAKEKPPEQNQITTPHLTMVGYGRREDGGTGKKFSVTVPVTQKNLSEIALGGASLDSCEGDSGGPAFDQEGHVVAVISRGLNIGCGGGGVATVVADAACWIRQESLARNFDIPVDQPCGDDAAQRKSLTRAAVASNRTGSSIDISGWYLESILGLHELAPSATFIDLKGNHLRDVWELLKIRDLKLVDISFNDIPMEQVDLLNYAGIQVRGVHTQTSTFLNTRFLAACLKSEHLPLPTSLSIATNNETIDETNDETIDETIDETMIKALKARFASNDCNVINSRLVKTLHLNIRARKINTLGLLADLPLLEILDISSNPLISLAPLLSLENLKSVKLGDLPQALLEAEDDTIGALIGKGIAIEFDTNP